jgi:hypothetical protein
LQIKDLHRSVTAALTESDSLKEDLDRPVRAFLVNFQIYMEHLGSLRAQVALLPDGIWPMIDTTASMLADEFIRAHELEHVPLPARAQQAGLGELLAFLLKTAWIQGYLMYKFREHDYVPAPAGPIDPAAIMDSVAAPNDPDHPILAASIPVTLQRAVSLLTEPEPLRASLQAIDASLSKALDAYLDDWSAKVRDAHGWGIFIARAESEYRGASQSKGT